MKCLEIRVNDERLCVAGAEDAVVFAFISPDRGAPGTMSLIVHGSSTDQATSYQWSDKRRHVTMGDAVIIRVVEASAPDIPIRSPLAFPQLAKDLFEEAARSAVPQVRRSLLFWATVAMLGVAIWFFSSFFSGRG